MGSDERDDEFNKVPNLYPGHTAPVWAADPVRFFQRKSRGATADRRRAWPVSGSRGTAGIACYASWRVLT